MSYEEAKFGLRIRDSDPMDVDAVNSPSFGKEKGHQVRAMGVLSAVVHVINEIAIHARAQASNRVQRQTEQVMVQE